MALKTNKTSDNGNEQITIPQLPDGLTYTFDDLMTLNGRDKGVSFTDHPPTHLPFYCHALGCSNWHGTSKKVMARKIVARVKELRTLDKARSTGAVTVAAPAQAPNGDRVYSNGTANAYNSPENLRKAHENTIAHAAGIQAIWHACNEKFNNGNGKGMTLARNNEFNAEVKARFGRTCGCKYDGCHCKHANGSVEVPGKKAPSAKNPLGLAWLPTRSETMPNAWGETKVIDNPVSPTMARQATSQEPAVDNGADVPAAPPAIATQPANDDRSALVAQMIANGWTPDAIQATLALL